MSKAPMPSNVLSVLKREGDGLKQGEMILIIGSMKIELILAGTRRSFQCYVEEGQAVREGAVLRAIV